MSHEESKESNGEGAAAPGIGPELSAFIEPSREKVGLALSGGGFRATLFHIGSILRLNELGYLEKMSRIVSVSGGSIAAAHLGLIWGRLRFRGGTAVNLREEFVEPLRQFCGRDVDKGAIYLGLRRPWRLRRPGNLLEEIYRDDLFGNATLQDLPDVPEIFLLTTNLLSEETFRFSKSLARDRYIQIPSPRFSLSACVAASSAFPPIFSPFTLRLQAGDIDEHLLIKTYTPEFDFEALALKTKRLFFTDAGVVDNRGVRELQNACGTILISDASAPHRHSVRWWHRTWLGMAIRAARIAAAQAAPFQVEEAVEMFLSHERSGALWRIAADLVISPWLGGNEATTLEVSREMIETLATMRTRLNAFTDKEQGRLINWGYAASDASIRAFVDHSAPRPIGWPFPDSALA